MTQPVRHIVEDIPETRTVSAGLVAAILGRVREGSQWRRASPYYLVATECRARDFQDETGCVWCACEVQMDTPHGFRTRLVLLPKGQQHLACSLARQGGTCY